MAGDLHRRLAVAATDAADRWADAARAAGQAADELHRVHRDLPEHWRTGVGLDNVNETLRRLVRRLEEAHDTYRAVAEALAVRDREVARAGQLISRTVAEAHQLGLVVTPDGEVVPPAAGAAPMAVRALARRLSATLAEAMAHADAARARTADVLASLAASR
ncbi:hypothetical protein ACVCAH_19015 [Micromonospora sp. LZ34]